MAFFLFVFKLFLVYNDLEISQKSQKLVQCQTTNLLVVGSIPSMDGGSFLWPKNALYLFFK